MKDTERQRHRQREKQAPCRKPDTGLNPKTPGSCPGPRAGAKPLSHPDTPLYVFNFKKKFLFNWNKASFQVGGRVIYL